MNDHSIAIHILKSTWLPKCFNLKIGLLIFFQLGYVSFDVLTLCKIMILLLLASHVHCDRGLTDVVNVDKTPFQRFGAKKIAIVCHQTMTKTK